MCSFEDGYAHMRPITQRGKPASMASPQEVELNVRTRNKFEKFFASMYNVRTGHMQLGIAGDMLRKRHGYFRRNPSQFETFERYIAARIAEIRRPRVTFPAKKAAARQFREAYRDPFRVKTDALLAEFTESLKYTGDDATLARASREATEAVRLQKCIEVEYDHCVDVIKSAERLACDFGGSIFLTMSKNSAPEICARLSAEYGECTELDEAEGFMTIELHLRRVTNPRVANT